MSRNELFLFLACAIVVTMISGGPAPLTRSSVVTLASLLSPASTDDALGDPALFQQTFNHQ